MHWFAPFLPFSALLSSGMFFIRLDGSPNYAMLCNAVPGGHQHRTGLRFHLHPRLGHDGRGAGHEPRLYRGCGDDPRLLGTPPQRRAPVPCEDEPQEHAPDPPQCGLHVPAGAFDLPLRGGHRHDDVRRELRFHPLSGRGRRGGVQHRLLLLPDHLHGLQRHRAVGPADFELQFRCGKRRARAQGLPVGAPDGRGGRTGVLRPYGAVQPLDRGHVHRQLLPRLCDCRPGGFRCSLRDSFSLR